MPAVSSGTIRICENPGVARLGIEPGSPWWKASRLTAQPPQPPNTDEKLQGSLLYVAVPIRVSHLDKLLPPPGLSAASYAFESPTVSSPDHVAPSTILIPPRLYVVVIDINWSPPCSVGGVLSMAYYAHRWWSPAMMVVAYQDGGMNIGEGSGCEGISGMLGTERKRLMVVLVNVVDVINTVARRGTRSKTPLRRHAEHPEAPFETYPYIPLPPAYRARPPSRRQASQSPVLSMHLYSHCAFFRHAGGGGVVLAERLACSPPTKVNRARSPAGPLSDFRTWETCRTMPLAGGFPLGSTVSPLPFIREPLHTSITLDGSLDLTPIQTKACFRTLKIGHTDFRLLRMSVTTARSLPTELSVYSWRVEIWVALNVEVLRADEGKVRRVRCNTGIQGGGKREIPEKTCRPATYCNDESSCSVLVTRDRSLRRLYTYTTLCSRYGNRTLEKTEVKQRATPRTPLTHVLKFAAIVEGNPENPMKTKSGDTVWHCSSESITYIQNSITPLGCQRIKEFVTLSEDYGVSREQCRERKKNIKASEYVNVDVFTQNNTAVSPTQPNHIKPLKIHPKYEVFGCLLICHAAQAFYTFVGIKVETRAANQRTGTPTLKELPRQVHSLLVSTVLCYGCGKPPASYKRRGTDVVARGLRERVQKRPGYWTTVKVELCGDGTMGECKGGGKWKSPEKIHLPTATSNMLPTCKTSSDSAVALLVRQQTQKEIIRESSIAHSDYLPTTIRKLVLRQRNRADCVTFYIAECTRHEVTNSDSQMIASRKVKGCPGMKMRCYLRFAPTDVWFIAPARRVTEPIVASVIKLQFLIRGGHGGRAINTLDSHQGEWSSIPSRVTGLSHVGIMPDDAVGKRVFSGISRTGAAPYSLQSPSSALKTSLLRAAQISSLTLPLYPHHRISTQNIWVTASRPGRSGLSHVRIVPDDTVGRRVFSGVSWFPALSFRHCSILTSIILIGSQDLDVKSRPDLFTSLHVIWMACYIGILRSDESEVRMEWRRNEGLVGNGRSLRKPTGQRHRPAQIPQVEI
ncbi:hypothetical protein PR048_001475 [Dryococelus australis]|uniref:Uncharacterized protein n=1 Tax=Dryococelus australis TaxID=614101 RepID=A0ABQ9IHG4_9NEOP|nr:hypothetical protein PR048_001475 [Dryococelus australis]